MHIQVGDKKIPWNANIYYDNFVHVFIVYFVGRLVNGCELF